MEEFSISEFLKYYFSKIIIVILFVLIGFVAAMYYTEKLQVPMFHSQTSLVLTRSSSSDTITQNDISLNKNLVSTYREIIKSRRILLQVIDNLGLSLTEQELSNKISVKSANDTELIIISVSDAKAKNAKNIANEIAEVFKEEITSIYNIENINIVDEAVEESSPYNVNPAKQYTIGVGGGFLLSSMIVCICFYFDDSVKKAEDIEEKVGLSVLSTVPKYKKRRKK